jgi:hypothetical protein
MPHSFVTRKCALGILPQQTIGIKTLKTTTPKRPHRKTTPAIKHRPPTPTWRKKKATVLGKKLVKKNLDNLVVLLVGAPRRSVRPGVRRLLLRLSLPPRQQPLPPRGPPPLLLIVLPPPLLLILLPPRRHVLVNIVISQEFRLVENIDCE